jgi:hypothetical protein
MKKSARQDQWMVEFRENKIKAHQCQIEIWEKILAMGGGNNKPIDQAPAKEPEKKGIDPTKLNMFLSNVSKLTAKPGAPPAGLAGLMKKPAAAKEAEPSKEEPKEKAAEVK